MSAPLAFLAATAPPTGTLLSATSAPAMGGAASEVEGLVDRAAVDRAVAELDDDKGPADLAEVAPSDDPPDFDAADTCDDDPRDDSRDDSRDDDTSDEAADAADTDGADAADADAADTDTDEADPVDDVADDAAAGGVADEFGELVPAAAVPEPPHAATVTAPAPSPAASRACRRLIDGRPGRSPSAARPGRAPPRMGQER